MKNKILLIIILFTQALFSQQEKDTITSWSDRYTIFEGDTIFIKLPEMQLLGKLKFKTNYDKRYYYWYRKKVLKAYPYAKLASERLEELNKRLSKIESKRKRKRYTKIVQRYLEDQFTAQLKDLTRIEGRILLKLIYRQTGKTAYDLVRKLRSGWNAFWYNTTASMFNLSLKSTYDPVANMEDYMIEDILQRAFSDGVLDEQKPKEALNYFDSGFKEIDVEKFVKKKKK